MTTAPFAPKGAVPEWRLVYEQCLAGAEYGDVITYDDLDAVLGRDFRTHRGPIYRARRELGEVRHRWLSAVPTIGYRVIEAREHVSVANGHKRRARGQLTRMQIVTTATDLGRLTQEELTTFDAQTRINAALIAIAFSHEQRFARIEETLRKNGML